MFLEHFGLVTNPFGLSPRLEFLFKSTAFEESMAHLVYGLDNSEAIVMITGSIGTGKTMAMQSFLTNLGPNFTFALVTNTKVNSLELLKLILEDLEVPFAQGSDKSDVLILFKDFLIAESKAGRKVLVVIDEAQNLDHDVLEELRLLTNLGQGDSQPVQLILLGQPELSANVMAPGLAQLRQRIRVHYTLDTLTRAEVEGYINHRMSVAGCSRPMFSRKALDRIHEHSNGVPRLVNSLAGNGLLSAYVAEHEQVQAEDIDPSELISAGDVGGDAATAGVAAMPRAREEVQVPVQVGKDSDSESRKGYVAAIWFFLVVVLGAGGWYGYSQGYFDSILSTTDAPPPAVSQDESPPVIAVDSIPQVQAAAPDTTAAETAVEDDARASADTTQVSEPALVAVVADPVPAAPAEPEPQATEPEAEPEPEPEPQAPEFFEAHIASFRTRDRAVGLYEKIKPLTDKVFMRDILANGSNWYRVYLGPFDDQKEIEGLFEQVKAVTPVPYFRVGKYSEDGNVTE
jgi:general secretion pathway protein A